MRVYFIEAYPGDRSRSMIKIGKAKDPRQRMQELQIGSPCKLRMLGVITCGSDAAALLMESRLHSVFETQRRRGEWFRLSDKQRAALLRIIERKGEPLA